MPIISWIDLRYEQLVEAINNIDSRSIEKLNVPADFLRERLMDYIETESSNNEVYVKALKHLEEIGSRKK